MHEQMVEDWNAVKKRWEAWWAGDVYDRAVVCVSAPRAAVDPSESRAIASVKTRWTNIDFMIQRMRETIRKTWYGGEAVPLFWHNWSAGNALLLGCEPHFEEDTVWVDPAPLEENGYPRIEGWEKNPWWRWMVQATEKAARESHGQWFVMPCWGNHAGDTLALIRDSNQLMLDLVENPAWVKRAVKQVSDSMLSIQKALWPLVEGETAGVEGSVNYCGCWSPGRTLGFDCDISCMVSPQVFQEVFLSPLVENMLTVDHRIYHLDGVCALHHLETLLSLPQLHAIQWIPGAGREDVMQWLPLLRQIQSRGKAVVAYTRPEQVKSVLEALSPEGLCLCTSCSTEDEGKRLLKSVTRRARNNL